MDENGDCRDCGWYEPETRLCRNPDADYMLEQEPAWGCSLWEPDEQEDGIK